jgi:uncharacterized protein (AIM24 family)
MTYPVLEEKTFGNTKIEVLDYGTLKGSNDAAAAERLYFLRESGMKLKSVRITLRDTAMLLEPGALYYKQGKLEMKTKVGSLMSGLMRSMTSGETFFTNQIAGTGTVVLEPSYAHFLIVEIDNDELVCDKGMFYASVGDLVVSSKLQKASAALFGGEGLFQTHIKGTGLVVLASPVPMEELVAFDLDDGPLLVDGNFALMRVGTIAFDVTKSSKSWLQTSVSGEGLLQRFTGKGIVWLAPTQKIYQDMQDASKLAALAQVGSGRNTRT